MYIYLDESYNLKDRSKKQFISINGFMVLDEKMVFKKWKNCRRPFLNKKRRIHAKDYFFYKLRAEVQQLITQPNLTLLSTFQVLQEIPFNKKDSYFHKNGLNFDQIYLDLIVELFKILNLQEYREVKIIIDNRKCKNGILGKNIFKQAILNFVQQEYKQTKFKLKIQPSSTDILLELADFISNIFYRAYIYDDKKFFEDLRYKIIQIKNPLK